MKEGEIIVEGDVGAYLGAGMKGGKIEVKGNAGVLAGASMAGGTLAVGGDTGERAGGILVGETLGMRGGLLTIGGNAGPLLGERMRRGLVIVNGDAGDYLGGRMIAGTILVKHRVGRFAGYGLRRGSLILLDEPKELLPTFGDCGVMEFTYLRLLEHWLREQGKCHQPRRPRAPVDGRSGRPRQRRDADHRLRTGVRFIQITSCPALSRASSGHAQIPSKRLGIAGSSPAMTV